MISLDLPELPGLDLSLGVSLPPGESLADGLVRAGRWLDELNSVLAGSVWETLGTSAGDSDDLLRVSLRHAGPPRTGPAPSAPGPFPLTEMQLAYLVGRADGWLGDHVAPHYYTEVDVTDLDVTRLTAAVRGVVSRHPMLRAVITPDVRQRVLPDPPVPDVEVIDLRELAVTQGPRPRQLAPGTSLRHPPGLPPLAAVLRTGPVVLRRAERGHPGRGTRDGLP
jgi:hypothetical protein